MRTSISIAVKKAVKKRDKNRCVECSRYLIEMDFIEGDYIFIGHFHHIIPVFLGGTNEVSNICLLCEKCHRLIHKRDHSMRLDGTCSDRYYEMDLNFLIAKHLYGTT